MEIVRQEGKRLVRRNIEIYNLDMILSIGYRVNRKNATLFRQWANRVLKDLGKKLFAFSRVHEAGELIRNLLKYKGNDILVTLPLCHFSPLAQQHVRAKRRISVA